MPAEFVFSHLLAATGWTPEVLAATDMRVVENYMDYLNVRHVAECGGTFLTEAE